jgi:hypothetical protein
MGPRGESHRTTIERRNSLAFSLIKDVLLKAILFLFDVYEEFIESQFEAMAPTPLVRWYLEPYVWCLLVSGAAPFFFFLYFFRLEVLILIAAMSPYYTCLWAQIKPGGRSEGGSAKPLNKTPHLCGIKNDI